MFIVYIVYNTEETVYTIGNSNSTDQKTSLLNKVIIFEATQTSFY